MLSRLVPVEGHSLPGINQRAVFANLDMSCSVVQTIDFGFADLFFSANDALELLGGSVVAGYLTKGEARQVSCGCYRSRYR